MKKTNRDGLVSEGFISEHPFLFGFFRVLAEIATEMK